MGGGPVEVRGTRAELTDGPTPIGIVTVTVRDARGRFVSRRVIRNKTTNYMRQAVAQWMCAAALNTGPQGVLPPDRIALGTGSPPSGQTGASALDTALWNETAGTRKVCSYRNVTMTYYAQFNVTYQGGDPNGTFTEAGLFDAAGNLWAHVILANIAKTAGSILTLQWKIQLVGN